MTPTTKIPFLDLVTPHQEAGGGTDCSVAKKAFSTAGFIGGPMVEDFEREFAAFCDTKYCVGVNSGTDALRFAFMAAGVEQGDIIVTVPHTFIATTEAISQAGAQIAVRGHRRIHIHDGSGEVTGIFRDASVSSTARARNC